MSTNHIPHARNHEEDKGGRDKHPGNVTSLDGCSSAVSSYTRARQDIHLIEDVKILDQGVTSSPDGAIVRFQGYIVQVSSAHRAGARHGEGTDKTSEQRSSRVGRRGEVEQTVASPGDDSSNLLANVDAK